MFARYSKVVSAEATLSHFGSRLNDSDRLVQAWNLAACFSLLSLGTSRFRLR